MPAEFSYDYAIVRVVPRVDRGETINAGVVLSCAELSFLEARIELDAARLLALDASLDIEAIRDTLSTIPIVCAGGAAAGAGRRAGAARSLPLAGVAAQHRHSDVAGAHRPHERSGCDPRALDGDHGASASGGRRVARRPRVSRAGRGASDARSRLDIAGRFGYNVASWDNPHVETA